jgi:hypothetical protein
LHAAGDHVAQAFKIEGGSEDAKSKANAVVGDGKIRQVLDFMKELIEDGNQALSGTGRLYCDMLEAAIPAYPPLLKSLYWSTAMSSIDGSTKLGDTSKSRMKELYTPLRGRDISSNSISIKLDEEVVGWIDGKIEARNNNRYMHMNGVYIGHPENCLAFQEVDLQHTTRLLNLTRNFRACWISATSSCNNTSGSCRR